MSDRKRMVKFERGFNCREYECAWDKDGCVQGQGGFHGVHGMAIRFLLKGDEGAVQFLLYTGWIPTDKHYHNARHMHPIPVDLGYYGRKPHYDDQESMGPCEFLDGAACYYDGSSLQAESAWTTLINGGEDDLWRFLGEYYDCTFHGGEYPKVGEYFKPLRENNDD